MRTCLHEEQRVVVGVGGGWEEEEGGRIITRSQAQESRVSPRRKKQISPYPLITELFVTHTHKHLHTRAHAHAHPIFPFNCVTAQMQEEFISSLGHRRRNIRPSN